MAGLVFGPTAGNYNDAAPEPVQNPDFSKVFLLEWSLDAEPKQILHQTDIGLEDVLAGFEQSDNRLARAVIPRIQSRYEAQH